MKLPRQVSDGKLSAANSIDSASQRPTKEKVLTKRQIKDSKLRQYQCDHGSLFEKNKKFMKQLENNPLMYLTDLTKELKMNYHQF